MAEDLRLVKKYSSERLIHLPPQPQMSSIDGAIDSNEKNTTQLNKHQVLTRLKEDLGRYEAITSKSDTLSDDQILELFDIKGLNNLELIAEIKKFTNNKLTTVIDIESRNPEQLVELETQLSEYFSKLEALQRRMDTRLDNLILERDELFVICQLLVDKLE